MNWCLELLNINLKPRLKDNTTYEYAKATKDSFTNFTVTTVWDVRIVSKMQIQTRHK